MTTARELVSDPPQWERQTPPRIAVACPADGRDPATYSGTPAGFGSALERLGVDVVYVRVEPPPFLNFVGWNGIATLRLHRTMKRGIRPTIRWSRKVANSSPELAAMRSRAARRLLPAVAPLDGVIQWGTGFLLPPLAPVVTFEDMTVIQAVAERYPQWLALSGRAIGACIERQRTAYTRAVACCATTHWAARSIIGDYGIAPDKVHVAGIGRNRDPVPIERDWSRPRFLFVGKDWERKNGAAVVRAFVKLRERLPEARLDVVGNHPTLSERGVSGHGSLSERDPAESRRLEELFQAATCIVVPSRHEPAGIVYAEAAGAGIASIGTTSGGAEDIIGDAGIVVDPSDDQGLLNAMSRMAEPATARRLGQVALRRSRLLTWEMVARRLLRAFDLPQLPPDDCVAYL